MHENTKITLRQIVGAGKVQGRVVDEPREGPKMRTNLSILGWFIKSMSLSYHPTRVSWLFREIENTWSRTTVDWSLTVFLAFPPEGTLICSWASFFLSPLINSHALRLDTSSLAKRGEEKVGAGAGEFIFTRKISSFIFIILLRPESEQSQTLQGWLFWFHLDLVRKSKRRLLAMRGRKVMKTGKKMCIVPAISLSDIWVTHLLWNTWSDCHVSFNTGSNMWDVLVESLPSHIFCPCLLSPALCIYVWILQCWRRWNFGRPRDCKGSLNWPQRTHICQQLIVSNCHLIRFSELFHYHLCCWPDWRHSTWDSALMPE